MDIHIPDENIMQAPGSSATPMRVPADAQLPKKHQHGWECFKTSAGFLGAIELDTPLVERIEAVYKTAYRTGYKNGVADSNKVARVAALVDRLSKLEDVAQAAKYLHHNLSEEVEYPSQFGWFGELGRALEALEFP